MVHSLLFLCDVRRAESRVRKKPPSPEERLVLRETRACKFYKGARGTTLIAPAKGPLGMVGRK